MRTVKVLTITDDNQLHVREQLRWMLSLSFICSTSRATSTWFDGNGAQLRRPVHVDELCVCMYFVQVGNGAVAATTRSIRPFGCAFAVIIPHLGYANRVLLGALQWRGGNRSGLWCGTYSFVWTPHRAADEHTASRRFWAARTRCNPTSLGCDTGVSALILGPSPFAILPT